MFGIYRYFADLLVLSRFKYPPFYRIYGNTHMLYICLFICWNLEIRILLVGCAFGGCSEEPLINRDRSLKPANQHRQLRELWKGTRKVLKVRLYVSFEIYGAFLVMCTLCGIMHVCMLLVSVHLLYNYLNSVLSTLVQPILCEGEMFESKDFRRMFCRWLWFLFL
jgi:hypothetical protein